ncbi:S41 family peptidase [bacterium]|nr:S41 family peptidase [bacterium]
MRRKIIAATFILALACVAWMGFSGTAQNAYKNILKLQRVMDIVSQVYVEEVDANAITEAAIESMLKELDPHSVYFPPKESKAVAEQMQGDFEGIGATIEIVQNWPAVVTTVAGAPANRMGILAGDRIVKINDEKTEGWQLEQVTSKLRGPKGTKVHLTIQRPGTSESIDVDIVRDKIPLSTVASKFMLDKETGYISISMFSTKTADDVEKALQELEAQGLKNLILDLRGNGGGVLQQAFLVVDKFIPGDKLVVYTRGRIASANEDFYSSYKPKFRPYPLIVLMDRGAASASEVVAGAIQDLDRGLILGERSFGKGLTQLEYPLNDGSAVRITVGRYYTPSGRLIQRDYKDKSLKDYYRERMDENVTDSTKIFHTAKGRAVYGGGGIVPDHHIDSDTVGTYARYLWMKGAIRDFSNKFLEEQGPALRDRYKNDLPGFLKNYQTPEADLQAVVKTGETKGVPFDKAGYVQDKDFLANVLKAEAARYIWGNDASARVRIELDNVALEALKYFKEAQKFADHFMKTTSDGKN